MSTPLHPIALKILEKRGYPANMQAHFLSDDLRALPDLMALKDLEKATKRLMRAMAEGESIGVYGDYDVDGTTSCALLFHFFKSIGISVHLIQPSRFIEGYGIHAPSIQEAHERGIKVLITVDCGITADLAALRARELGLDLIITDHHQEALPELPKAFAIVNPNRSDEPTESPLRALAGVGVAFALCWSIKKELELQGQTVPSLYPLLALVAIGTISDQAKLTPMNLKLCRHGLRAIKTSPYPGIKSFFQQEELERPTIASDKIAFLVGPIINSKGRLEHPDMALKLLTTESAEEAQSILGLLKECNHQRKMIQAEVFQQAKEEVLREMKQGALDLIVVFKADWHEGVIGIVASKLVETFNVPAIVLTAAQETGLIKGSARAAGDFSIFELIGTQGELLVKFGGHKAAAGLTLKREDFARFAKRITTEIKKIPAILRTKLTSFDLEISATDVDVDLVRDLEKLEPFGMGNPSPIFRMRGMEIASFEILQNAHVRWTLKPQKNQKAATFRGISFNYMGKLNQLSPNDLFEAQKSRPLSIQCGIEINRFKGREYLQLQVAQISPE